MEVNDIITIEVEGNTTTVKVVKETPKAVLLKGNCSEAWFPKKAIVDGVVQPWMTLDIVHCFLWEAPYTGEAA